MTVAKLYIAKEDIKTTKKKDGKRDLKGKKGRQAGNEQSATSDKERRYFRNHHGQEGESGLNYTLPASSTALSLGDEHIRNVHSSMGHFPTRRNVLFDCDHMLQIVIVAIHHTNKQCSYCSNQHAH